MSTQRYIDTSFWDDAWIQELDPSEKLLYIYLLTNPLTNIAGVMELTVKRMSFDTGFNADTINHILTKFENAKKVYKYKNYIIIRNFPKHQQIENEKILKGIAAILCKLPDDLLCFLEEIEYELNIRETFDSLCIPYTYPSNYLNEFNTNLNLKEFNKPQSKNDATSENQSSDLKMINQAYYDLWASLYSRGLVQTEKPIISNFSVITNLEKKLLKSISVETIIQAIGRSESNDFVKNNGFSFQTILSGNVMNQLINGSVSKKTNYQQKQSDDYYKKQLENKIQLEEWDGK